MVKYIFDPLTFSENWNYSFLEILDQFRSPSLEMGEFSHFNKILLSSFDVSNTFLI